MRLDPDFAALVHTDDFYAFLTAEGETEVCTSPTAAKQDSRYGSNAAATATSRSVTGWWPVGGTLTWAASRPSFPRFRRSLR